MFHLDFGPAFGQAIPMLMPVDWSESVANSDLKLSDYAEQSFKNEESFFLIVPQYLGSSQKPMPLAEYLEIPSSKFDFTAIYVFSTSGQKEPFRFQVALPNTKNLKFHLYALHHLDSGKWVRPKTLLKLMSKIPRTEYWHRQIADYALMNYGPELQEWKELVIQINAFIPVNQNPSAGVRVFQALNQKDSCAAFLQCNATESLQGCSIYVYYSLHQGWAKNPVFEHRLKTRFEEKKRHLTQIYCLAYLSITECCQRTARYLKSYKRHANHGVHADKRLDWIERQSEMALFSQLHRNDSNPLVQAKASYYLSVIYSHHHRQAEAKEMRQRAMQVASKSLRDNPKDADALELQALLYRNSPLAQNRALAEHYRSRSLSDAKLASATQSPRWENSSPRLEISHDASASTSTAF